MDPTQNDAFGSFSSGQGGGAGQTGGYVGAPNNVETNGQQIISPMPTSIGGPIVLNNDGEGKKSRKWVIIAVALLVLGMVVAGVLVALNLRKYSNNEQLSSILKSDSDGVQKAESFFGHIKDGDVSFELLFSQMNNNSTFMEELISPVKDLQKQVEVINGATLSVNVNDLLEKTKNVISKRLSIFNELSDICTVFYGIYKSSDSVAASRELLNSDDKQIASLAQWFYDYFSRRAQILSDMSSDGCDDQFANPLCLEKYFNEYRENEEFMSDGDKLANIMVRLSSPDGYGETFLISNMIDELLYENDEVENE